jgi:hypothetical protein
MSVLCLCSDLCSFVIIFIFTSQYESSSAAQLLGSSFLENPLVQKVVYCFLIVWMKLTFFCSYNPITKTNLNKIARKVLRLEHKFLEDALINDLIVLLNFIYELI